MSGYNPPQGVQGHMEGWARDPYLYPPKEVRLASGTCSNQATLDLDLRAFVKNFKAFSIALINFLPATDDAVLWLRTSSDGGASYDAAAGNYGYSYGIARGAAANETSNADTEIQLTNSTGTVSVGSGAAEGLCGEIQLFNPSSSTFWVQVIWHVGYVNAEATPRSSSIHGAGARRAAADVDAIRFLFSTGNIASGIWSLYGVN